jgi:hypothetical protein
MGIGGACAGLRASHKHRHATMALDPEEIVTLTDHGTMKSARSLSIVVPAELLEPSCVIHNEPLYWAPQEEHKIA